MPVELRVEQPVLLLELMRTLLDQWQVNHIQHLRSGSVFIPLFLFRDFLMLAVADRPNPGTSLAIDDFPSRDTTAAELA